MSDKNVVPEGLPASPPNGKVAGHTNGSAAVVVLPGSQSSAGANTQAGIAPAPDSQPSSGAAPQELPSGGGPEPSGKEMVFRTLFDSSPIYTVVVIYLGLVGLIVILGALYFENGGREISSGLLALGTGAIGAITGLLVPSPMRK